MTKYIKNKDGKFAGSLPEEPNLVSAPNIPVIEPPVVEEKPAFGTPEWREWAEARRLEREAKDKARAEAREMIENFTDKIVSEFPEARFFVYDSNWNPLRIEGYNNKVVIDLTAEEHGALADTLAIESSNLLDGLSQMRDSEYRSEEDVIGVSLLIRCTESEDCNYRRPAVGIGPRHKASDFCRSGKRPHCTCDTCF